MRNPHSGRPRVLLFAAAGLAALGLATAGEAVAGSAGAAAPAQVTVKTAGGGRFTANVSVTETLHFDKNSYTVASGGTLTFLHGPHDVFSDPHTLTVAPKKLLPRTALQADHCGGPGTACALAQGNEPSPSNPNGVPFVDVGKTGLDEVGDSVGIAPVKGASFSVKVTAPKGSTLYFFCAVHPWMQAVLHVR